MRYLGGKSRLVKRLVPELLRRGEGCTTYLEPFVGGGSVLEVMAPHFGRVVAADSREDLILMWRAFQAGWNPPRSVTREEYERLRTDNRPSAWRALVGFGSSYAGKWFGGYVDGDPRCREGHTYLGATIDSCRRTLAKLPDTCRFECADFSHWSPAGGTLVYCDPPYRGTTDYSGQGAFDSDAFWEVASTWARAGATVLVSEEQAPDGWVPAASWSRKGFTKLPKEGSLRDDRTEVLWMKTQ